MELDKVAEEGEEDGLFCVVESGVEFARASGCEGWWYYGLGWGLKVGEKAYYSGSKFI